MPVASSPPFFRANKSRTLTHLRYLPAFFFCHLLSQLTPFSSAKSVADGGCGGAANNDPGVSLIIPPENVFTAGTSVPVRWRLTIPHPIDVEDTGIRVSLHYESGSSFACNILKGGLEGDPGYDDRPNMRVAAGPTTTTAPNTEVTVLVDLPADQTCDYCVLQWVWAARADGGFYMGCADIAITLPGAQYNPLNPETSSQNPLPVNQPTKGYPCVFLDGSTGGGANAGVIVLVIIILLVVGAAAYALRGKICAGGKSNPLGLKGGGDNEMYNVATPSAPAGGGGLPPGWSSATDPSGRTYYVNSATNQTQWDPPVAPKAPPAGSMAMPGGLPPGWQAVTQENGQTYFYNASTGATSWERPTR